MSIVELHSNYHIFDQSNKVQFADQVVDKEVVDILQKLVLQPVLCDHKHTILLDA